MHWINMLGFLLLQLTTVFVHADTVDTDEEGWTAVVIDKTFIAYDENIPIEIKTDSEIGSHDNLLIYVLAADQDTYCGDVYVHFKDTPAYTIENCLDEREFTTAFPSEKDKVVTISRTKESGSTRIVIQVNDKEMLNVVVSKDTCIDGADIWGDIWQGDHTPAFIQFDTGDDASDFWRLEREPCSAGEYMNVIDGICQQCGENTYSGAGAFKCTSCPDDKISDAGSASESACKLKDDKKQDYSGALLNSLSGIIIAFALILFI